MLQRENVQKVPPTNGYTSTSYRLVNVKEVQRTYELLTAPGQVIEVRALKATLKPGSTYKQTLAGYFDNSLDLIKEISKIQQAVGIYITLQPCEPDLLHRAKNKLIPQEQGSSTSDKDIVGYRWIPIDVDTKRKVKGISATEEEHQRALNLAQEICETMRALGWPDPIRGDSANGAHLLWRVELSVEEADLIKRWLAGMAAKFDTPELEIDQKVYNPARIWKLYGTLACKGDNTEERPHRFAQIREVPERLEVVTRDQLEAVALPEPVQEEKPASRNTSTGERMTSPEDFLRRHSINFKQPYDNGGKKIWVLTDGCVFNSEHRGKDAAVIELPDGRWCYNCFHNGCRDKSWADFAKHVEPGYMTSEEKNAAYEAAQAAKKAAKPKKDDATDEEKEEKPNQTQILLQICKRAKYFKTPEGDLCASVPINGHRETVVLGEKGGFRMWLIKRYYDQTGNAANTTATQQAIEIVAAGVMENATIEPLFTRVGSKDGKIYLDMANDKHQVIEIGPAGWRVLDISPVYFRKPSGTLPLPTPVGGGTIEELRPFLNINPKNEETGEDVDWYMIVGYILMMLHPSGPYPVLSLGGEQGATKSSTARAIRKLIDPNIALSRPVPKEERDMAILARSNWILSFENLSHIPEWLSDAMCRMSTGAGYGTRALWENDKEAVFANKRPQMVNGISDLITKSDLLSRTISVGLPVMDKSKYKRETKIDEKYDEAHPRMLGALLTIISTAIRNLPDINAPSTSRMVEMEMWVRAAESALGWKTGSFSKCFVENQDNGIDVVLEASQVAKAVMAFMDERGFSWAGNSTLLYTQLKTAMGHDLDYKSWPANAKTLSDALKKLAPALRARGYQVIHRRTGKERKIELSFSDAEVTQTTRKVTQSDAGVTQENSPASPPAKAKTPENTTMSDAGDAENTTLSNLDFFEKEEEERKKQLIEEAGISASPASHSSEIDTENQSITCAICHIPIEETEDFQFDNDGVGYCSDCWQQVNG